MGAFLRGVQGIAVTAVLVVTACTPFSGSTSPSDDRERATKAVSADDLGGMDALVEAARKEGTLNVVALPPGWANYGEIIKKFQDSYGIKVHSQNPNGSSADEIKAVKDRKGTDTAPDVLDIATAVAVANTDLFAPYKVRTWADIPDTQKEATGLWFQDYGGYLSIGYDSARVPAPTSVADLLKPAYKGKVALTGDPATASTALHSVVMASLASGGGVDDLSKGIDFFRQLKASDNLLPIQATSTTVQNATTPVVLDWDYLSTAQARNVPTWKVFVPSNAVLGSYYAQAIAKAAPHPAAARLWEEFLYSDEGQNLWLRGGARPVRWQAMTTAGTIDRAAVAALPETKGVPVFLSEEQTARAKAYLAANWAKAIG